MRRSLVSSLRSLEANPLKDGCELLLSWLSAFHGSESWHGRGWPFLWWKSWPVNEGLTHTTYIHRRCLFFVSFHPPISLFILLSLKQGISLSKTARLKGSLNRSWIQAVGSVVGRQMQTCQQVSCISKSFKGRQGRSIIPQASLPQLAIWRAPSTVQKVSHKGKQR